MFLAERNLIQIELKTQDIRDGLILGFSKVQSLWIRMFRRGIFLVGLYLGSFPRGENAAPQTPGFVFMSTLTSDDRYWQSYAAILMLWSISNDQLLQSCFASPFLSYLDKVSFSLYLIHGPVLHLFGYGLVRFCGELQG
jgi:peptidoglycan/LPS O-acetylase OafA/YrhL